VLVVGGNGTGKTNLLESLHVGTQGFSPRTRNDAQLIRLGTSAAAIGIRGTRAGVSTDLRVRLSASEPKRADLNGSRLASSELLRREIATLVFTPDRLTVVKGGPAARRAYFDRVLGRLWPARAGLPQDYLAALTQRNAGLRRVQLGYADRTALDPWTARVAELGAALTAARRETLTALGPGFTERADELGLAGAGLGYDADAPTVEQLEARLQADLERGATGLGPHLDDVLVTSGDRDLRRFGSQGEQRLAVLSLILAEAELLPVRPLLLLDDVLSELDAGRRRALGERIAAAGQTVVTATEASALPFEPAQVVHVEHGSAT
jgi:DNA replication and repair protein RecF